MKEFDKLKDIFTSGIKSLEKYSTRLFYCHKREKRIRNCW